MKILIVEDDPIMYKAINNILTTNGYNTASAKNGKEAFEKLDQENYDLVLTDLMMSYANGLEVISYIKSNPIKSHIKVIVVSSVGNEETISEAYKLGCDDFLKKTIMVRELLVRIDRLLKR